MRSGKLGGYVALHHQNHGGIKLPKFGITGNGKGNDPCCAVHKSGSPLFGLLRRLARRQRAPHEPAALPRKCLHVMRNFSQFSLSNARSHFVQFCANGRQRVESVLLASRLFNDC
jgi:hypothetical protein